MMRPVGALPRGSTRYFVDQVDPLSGTTRRRSCIELSDGSSFYEVPFSTQDEEVYRPSIHFHQDMCGGSWYGPMAAVHGYLRGTLGHDRCHRHQNGKDDACRTAGLMVSTLEFAMANAVRRKPFGKEGNHRILHGVAKEMFAVHSATSELFAPFYDSICDDLDEPTAIRGTDEHQAVVWEKVKDLLSKQGVGSETKNSRWWSIELELRVLRPVRSSTAMLLTHMGLRRGWYKDFAHVPLLSDELAPFRDDGADLEIAAGPPVDAAGAAAAAPDEPGPEAPDAKLSMKSVREELAARRKECANHMQYASKVLSRRSAGAHVDGMEFLTRPLETLFTDEVASLKTVRGTVYAEGSRGRQVQVRADGVVRAISQSRYVACDWHQGTS